MFCYRYKIDCEIFFRKNITFGNRKKRNLKNQRRKKKNERKKHKQTTFNNFTIQRNEKCIRPTPLAFAMLRKIWVLLFGTRALNTQQIFLTETHTKTMKTESMANAVCMYLRPVKRKTVVLIWMCRKKMLRKENRFTVD